MPAWPLLVLFFALGAFAQTTDIVQRTYRCAGGIQIRAVYQNQFDRVGVVFNRQTYGPLFRVEAPSGIKFSDGRASWWTKSTGNNQETFLMSERTGQVLARGCRPLR